MGMTAFVMAGLTGVSYVDIMKMAVLPSLIYFLTLGVYVYLLAGKRGMARENPGAMEKIDLKELAISSINFIVPLATVVVLLIQGFSVNYVGFWAIIITVAISLVRAKTRPSPRQFLEGFIAGAKQGAAIGTSVACVGLILSTLSMSGIGGKADYRHRGMEPGVALPGPFADMAHLHPHGNGRGVHHLLHHSLGLHRPGPQEDGGAL